MSTPGLSIRIQISISYTDPNTVASKHGNCPATKPLMILLVEDYQASRKAVANFLRFAGYEVHEADNAEGGETFSKGDISTF
jgi:response regulator RpfG family c-di-GMP phosphodiesterase